MSTIRSVTRAKTPGQSVVLVALILPVILAFVLLVIEVAERRLEVAMIEDALQQATRSAVQSLDYAALARDDDGLRATRDCLAVTSSHAGPCQGVVAVADRFLRTNLTGVRGLGESADTLAERVHWTVFPHGGTCSFSNGTYETQTTPLLCAEVRPVMTGLVGWGTYTPLITAADTLDATRRHP